MKLSYFAHPTLVAAILATTGTLRSAPATTPEINEEPIELDAVVVTPFALPRSADDFAQPIFLIQKNRLHRQTTATLGETLNGAPGVSSTYFGPGASRPIIRGMGGDRIRVLSNGLDTFDASVVSPDHAVTVEPMFAERIEVIRGPATLMYGSSAVGGVVNSVDPALPTLPPETPISGTLEGRYSSNNEEWDGAGQFSGGNERFGWYASALKRSSGDIGIPVPPEVEADEGEHDHEDEEHEDEDFDGTLPNSSVDTESFKVGLSTFWEKGHAGVAYTHYDTFYGIPGGHEHGHEHGEEHDEDHDDHDEEIHDEDIQVDLRQRRLLADVGIRQPVSWLEEVNLKLGFGDYEHSELEGEEVGTRFTSEALEARIDAVHPVVGGFVGAFGFDYAQTDFAASGEEAFIPPTDTTKGSLFAVETYSRDLISAQFGLRFEDQSIETTDGTGRFVDKTGLSFSVGGVWRFATDYSIGLSLSRTERLPNAQELFADGPHAATRAYEIGDPNLGKEKAWSADLVLRKRTGRVTGQLSIFANRFERYIYEERTDQEIDGLPVYRFVARDAEFTGGEVEAVFHAHETEGIQVDFKVMADTVRATNTTTDQPLPRITPNRFGLGFEVRSGDLSFGAEGRHAAAQNRTAPLETPTDSYDLLSFYASYDLDLGSTSWNLYLQGTNVTNREARSHTSFLKDEVPLPGRNLIVGLRLTF
jgi:iron complex outermembrane receptor protein